MIGLVRGESGNDPPQFWWRFFSTCRKRKDFAEAGDNGAGNARRGAEELHPSELLPPFFNVRHFRKLI